MSKAHTIARHLIRRGHISQGSATLEYGALGARLSDVIHRLRNESSHLIPVGFTIITIDKEDTQGNIYGEYHLVRKQAAPEAEAA